MLFTTQRPKSRMLEIYCKYISIKQKHIWIFLYHSFLVETGYKIEIILTSSIIFLAHKINLQ